MRTNISTGSHFEAAFGYSRAVRVGDTVYVAGTVGLDYATRQIPDDPVAQFHNIVATFRRALAEAGARLEDVVQLTTYVTSADVFEAIGPHLGGTFRTIGPTNTALVVAFPFPGIKVEISAVAVVGTGGRGAKL